MSRLGHLFGSAVCLGCVGRAAHAAPGRATSARLSVGAHSAVGADRCSSSSRVARRVTEVLSVQVAGGGWEEAELYLYAAVRTRGVSFAVIWQRRYCLRMYRSVYESQGAILCPSASTRHDQVVRLRGFVVSMQPARECHHWLHREPAATTIICILIAMGPR